MPEAVFRFYGPLNDFLPRRRRQRALRHAFPARASVKDRIEALGVPHPEVALILVDGRPVGFDYLLQGGERVSVYPRFYSLEPPGPPLRPPLPGPPTFVLDGHLGQLATYLRMLGFDAEYHNHAEDAVLARSAAGGRVLLTRDRGLLKRGEVVYGYYVRQTEPRLQLVEVVEHFDLAPQARPFTRCLTCNTPLQPATPQQVADRVPPAVLEEYDEFVRCPNCEGVFWAGSHYDRMRRLVDEALAGAGGGAEASRVQSWSERRSATQEEKPG